MRTEHNHPTEAFALDSFFASARAAEVPPSEDLMARVLQQAEALQPKVLRPKPARSWAANLWRVLGGSGAMAGLVAAGVAGLVIGFLQPIDLAMASAATEETWDLYPAEIETYAFLLDAEPLLKD